MLNRLADVKSILGATVGLPLSLAEPEPGAFSIQSLPVAGADVSSPARFDSGRPESIPEDYRRLFNVLIDGAAILAADGRLEQVNRRMADLLGGDPAGLTGRPLSAWIAWPDRRVFAGMIREAGEGIGVRGVVRLLSEDGASHSVLLILCPISGEAAPRLAAILRKQSVPAAENPVLLEPVGGIAAPPAGRSFLLDGPAAGRGGSGDGFSIGRDELFRRMLNRDREDVRRPVYRPMPLLAERICTE